MRLSRLQPLFKNLLKDHKIDPGSKLVIDGKSFFQNTYRDSGCQYLLGGEYDRYAEHLKKIFKNFHDSNVTCYVVFNGAAATDMERRLEIHQKIIDQTTSIDPGKQENVFSEPIFAKDVFKEVLKELGIRYAVCEYDHIIEMVNLAKYYHCPLLTRNIEYSLLGVACISPKSLNFESNCIACKIYDTDISRERIALPHDKLSIFLVLMDEGNNYLRDLERLIGFRENNLLYKVHTFMRRQTRDAVLGDFKKQMAKDRYDMFMKDYNKIRDFMFRRKDSLVQEYLRGREINSEDWFAKGVIADRIAACYINLKNSSVFSGSWLICDNSKEDPMLSSINVVRLVHELLTNFRSTKITFVGRDGTESRAWELFDSIGYQRAKGTLGDVFKNGWSLNHLPDYLRYFFEVQLPGFDFNALEMIPEDCRMLMMALVYYSVKVDGDNTALVYSVMLSYTMLGPVTRVTGMLKRSNFNLMQNENFDSDVTTQDGVVERDCYAAARALINHFYASELQKKFDREVLHMFAEFQHCLQQLNYLNKLCGERMQSTIYHSSYNATFIYNLFLEIRFMMEPMGEIEEMLNESPSVLKYLKHLVGVFECCIESLTRT